MGGKLKLTAIAHRDIYLVVKSTQTECKKKEVNRQRKYAHPDDENHQATWPISKWYKKRKKP